MTGERDDEVCSHKCLVEINGLDEDVVTPQDLFPKEFMELASRAKD